MELKEDEVMRKKIRGLVFAVIFLFCLFQGIPGTGIYWADEVSAGDYTDAGCVAWAKDRAREKLGIILPDTGNYPSGVYGASNWWHVLPNNGYKTGSEPASNSLAIWRYTTGTYSDYGHVAYVESVSDNMVTITEGGYSWYNSATGQWDYGNYNNNKGVKCRTVSKSQMSTLGGCSEFYGYIYLSGSGDTTGPLVEDFHVGEIRKDSSGNTVGFTVIAKVTDSSGIKSVQYPTWTTKDGQDDIQWYDGYCTDNNGYYWHRVDFSDHKNEKGKYEIHIYAYDNAGNRTVASLAFNFDSTGPTYSNFHVGEFREGAFTVLADVSDAYNTIEYVKYAVWTKNNGQDDLKWYAGNNFSGNVNGNYWARVNFSDHKNEKGKYIIHMYVKIKGGESKSFGIEYDFPETGPVISDVKVTDISANGYTVSCKVNSVNDDVKVSKLQCPSWTLANEQDDLPSDWSTNLICKATAQGDGVYTFRVKSSEHNNETGLYRTHLYAYDVFGNRTKVAVPDVNVHDHSYSLSVIDPTEAEKGYTLHTCSICGDAYKDNYTDYKEDEPIHTHTYSSEITKNPTCTEKGIKEYKCKCGDIYTEDIPATGHKYVETVVDPTITEKGYTLHTCSNCGFFYKDNYTEYELTSDEGVETTNIKLQTEIKDNKIKFSWNVPDKSAVYGIVYALAEEKLDVAQKNNAYEVSGLKANGDTMTYECSTSIYKDQPDGIVWFRIVMKNGDEVKHSNAVCIKDWDDGKSSEDENTTEQPTTEKPTVKPTETPTEGASLDKITLSAMTVTAAIPYTNEIVFKWNHDSNAAGFDIEYSVNADLSNPKKAYWKKNSFGTYRLIGLTENTVYYYRVRSYKGEGDARKYSEWTSIASVITTAKKVTTEAPTTTAKSVSAPKIKLKSVKNNKKRSITVKWKWNVKVAGYQISYSKKKNFSGAKKKNVNARKDSTKITKLAKGKTYYVRVRAYVKSKGVKKYGKWSKVKKVKIKK